MILDEHSYWPEDVIRISANDGHSDDSRCTERMREYAETICYVPLEHEPKLTPFAALLAEVVVVKKKVIAGHDGRERAQCNLYLPVDLVERLRKAARAEGVSLNLWVTKYLEDKP